MTGDKCPNCGQPMPGAALPDDCLCGHGKVEHRFGPSETATSGPRGKCARILCGCLQYRPLGVPSDRQP